MYVDLDKFKPVNDKLGHAAGDELLVLVAERLRLASRDSDVVGRLGGDEFLVRAAGDPRAGDGDARGRADLRGAVRHLRALLRNGRAARQHRRGLLRAARRISSEELIKRADAAMYQSKQRGDSVPVLAAPGVHTTN